MRVLRSTVAAFVLVVALAIPATASQSEVADDAEIERISVVDHELLAALEQIGLRSLWFELSPHGRDVSRMSLTGGEELDSVRSGILDDAETLALSRSDELELLVAIDDVERTISVLEVFTRTLRERVVVGAPMLDADDALRFRKALLQARGASDDHVQLQDTLGVIDAVRQDLGRRLVALQQRTERDKTNDLGGLSAVLDELDGLYRTLDDLRLAALVTTEADQRVAERLEASLARFGELRRTASGPIDGLPAVTIDAYTTAGRNVDDGCGVDWRLLAGIGRIESLHGTLGGAAVSPSGKVSPSIFGPLLDGGAESRQADEAAAAAAAEEAELLRLAAEEEARVAAAEEERLRRLYGQPTPVPTPTPIFPTPTPVELEEAAEDKSEEDQDEPTGNGFAVIEDTDNGALDGNPRWDRAVGPMQFIPGTWVLFDTDGDGDGVNDPHNIYDATASAATYLCHLEHRNGGASPWVYVLGYNASSAYVADVMETATRLEIYDLD